MRLAESQLKLLGRSRRGRGIPTARRPTLEHELREEVQRGEDALLHEIRLRAEELVRAVWEARGLRSSFEERGACRGFSCRRGEGEERGELRESKRQLETTEAKLGALETELGLPVAERGAGTPPDPSQRWHRETHLTATSPVRSSAALACGGVDEMAAGGSPRGGKTHSRKPPKRQRRGSTEGIGARASAEAERRHRQPH